MKKIGGILVLFTLTLALISPVSAANLFQKDLRYGMSRNNEVKRLQQYLKEEKLYVGPLSGNYYSLTRSAVIKLQKKYNLKQDGNFTKVTRDKINELILAKEKTEQLTNNTQSEEQQLAESIAALKLYELTKTQEQVQPTVLASTEFTPSYIDTSLPFSEITYTTPPSQIIDQTTSFQPTTSIQSPSQNSTPITTPSTTTSVENSSPVIPTIELSSKFINTTGDVSSAGDFSSIVWKNYSNSYNCGGSPLTSVNRALIFDQPTIPNYIGYIKLFSITDPSVAYTIPTDADTIENVILKKFPRIDSITLKNKGTANLKNIDIVATQKYATASKNKPIIFSDDNTAKFILDGHTIEKIGDKYTFPTLDVYFRVNVNKINLGETLDLEVTEVELTNRDQEKNYMVKLPPQEEETTYRPIIRCSY